MGAGRISITAAHQRRGQCNGRLPPLRGEAPNGLSSGPTGGPASSGFGRSARSVRRGAGRASSAPQYHLHRRGFSSRCSRASRSTTPRVVSTVREPMTPTSCGSPRAGSRRGGTRGSRKGRPRRLRDGTQTLKKARSGMDIIPPTPKFGSGRIFTPRRRSRSRGRETFGHAVEPNDSPAPRGANAWDQRALLPRGCAPLARAPVSDPE